MGKHSRKPGGRRAARGARVAGGPFAVLGLPARGDVTDDDTRAAWRRIAAATHPDRDDGGSPERFAAAAAAYATLRTSFGRGEALADLAEAAAVPRWRRWRARDGWRFGDVRSGPRDRPPLARRLVPARRPRLAGRPPLTDWLSLDGRLPLRGRLPLAGRPSLKGQLPLAGRPSLRGRPPSLEGQLPLAGRLMRSGARLLAAVVVVGIVLVVAGLTPGTVGVAVGALTWLIAVLWPQRRGRRWPWS